MKREREGTQKERMEEIKRKIAYKLRRNQRKDELRILYKEDRKKKKERTKEGKGKRT